MSKNSFKQPSQNNFNLSFGYGEDLQEVPGDPSSMAQYCQEAVSGEVFFVGLNKK